MATTNKYSYSKIDTYKQCPTKFKIHYVDGAYCFVGNASTVVGSLIHETEETIANCIKDNLPINYVALKNNIILKMNEFEYKYPKDFNELDKTGRLFKEKFYDYLNNGIYFLESYMKANPNLEIVGAEVKFDFEYNDKYKFNGSIDRVLRDKNTGKYILQDIKTWPEPEKEENNSDFNTPLQFVVYSMAATHLYRCTLEDIECCQYYLPFCGNQFQTAGTKGYIKRGQDKLDKLFAGIEAENWEPKQSPLCHWCNYSATNPNAPTWAKYLCPYFSHWTKDNHTFEKENEYDSSVTLNTLVEAYHAKYGIKVPPKPEK